MQRGQLRRSRRAAVGSCALLALALLAGAAGTRAANIPLAQDGPRISPTDGLAKHRFGQAIALSADGQTLVVGSKTAETVWVFARSGSGWAQQAILKPGGFHDTGFGTSVAVSADGSALLVGGPLDGTFASFGPFDGAAWFYTRSDTTWSQSGPKLTAFDAPPAQEEFGLTVALSADGTTALVGAPDDGDLHAGSVYTYTRSGGGWTPGPKITLPGRPPDRMLGSSMSISADGNTVLLGVPHDDAGLVFTLQGGAWTQTGTLTGPTAGIGYGGAVSLTADGLTAIIGAPGSSSVDAQIQAFARTGGTWAVQGAPLSMNTGGFTTGLAVSADGNRALIGGNKTAILLTRSGTTWSQGPTLAPNDSETDALFGAAVALDAAGTTALVAGPYEGINAGAVWTFRPGDTGWVQQGSRLTEPNAVLTSGFGSSVALTADATRMVAGGPFDASTRGTAWVYRRTNGAWVEEARLYPPWPWSYPLECGFGGSVAVSDDGATALVGGTCGLWIFTRSGTSWSVGQKLALYAGALALSGDGATALVGVGSDNLNAGSVTPYVRSGNTWSAGTPLVPTDEVGEGHFGTAVALSDDGATVLVGGPGDAGHDVSGAAWVFTRNGAGWTQQGPKLTKNGPPYSSGFGVSGALSGDGNTAIVGGAGAEARVFGRSGGTWSSQGSPLVPGTNLGKDTFGRALALSTDGSIALVGGDSSSRTTLAGGAYLFGRNAGNWSQVAPVISPADVDQLAAFGRAVALSGDGHVAAIGAPSDPWNGSVGIFGRATQAITFAPLADHTFGEGDFTVTASASSGLPVAFSASGNCSLRGGFTIHLDGAGSCTVVASQDGDAGAQPAPGVAQAFAIKKGSQTITFGALQARKAGSADFGVGPHASSGLPVTLTASGKCTVAAGVVHLTGAGSCTITAAQPGNADYEASPSVARTFAITAATPAPKCVVPNLAGMKLAAAVKKLKGAHCRTGTTRYAYSTKAKKGRVVGQSIKRGRKLAANTKIGLTVGRGPRR